MRIVVKKYTDGGDYIFETTDDGSVLTRQLGGTRGEPGKRISAFLDVTCDDDEKGVEHLLEALSWLREEVEKRKAGLAEKKEKTKSVPKSAGVASARRS
jgi:hypothetical protein